LKGSMSFYNQILSRYQKHRPWQFLLTILITLLLLQTLAYSSPDKAWGLRSINVNQAWQVTKGSRDIIVAVIDTGVDVNHPSLRDNIWKNPKEIPNNGIDDDDNGYIDDVHGWNFVNHNSDVSDSHGHGTHIAGIIGATGNNKVGVVGVAPNVSIMVLKYFNPKGTGISNILSTVKSIQYAIQMGAHIINYSSGGFQPNRLEKKAIQEAHEKGLLFIAAAGNEATNTDNKPYYPADYAIKNIVSVTAYNKFQQILPTSNFGIKTVDIAAPGKNILSTFPNNRFGYMSGTSQATAFVSGAAALTLANLPEFALPEKTIRILTESADSSESFDGKTSGSRALNAYRSVALAQKPIHQAQRPQNIALKFDDLFNPSAFRDPDRETKSLINLQKKKA
jgi:thermitase